MTNEQNTLATDCINSLNNDENLAQNCVDVFAPLCCDENNTWLQQCIDIGLDVDVPMLCCTCDMELYYNLV